MRHIPEDKPLSAEDRQWLTDWGRFDQIRRIDEANGRDDSKPDKQIKESDLRATLKQAGVEVGEDDDVLDAVRALAAGRQAEQPEGRTSLGDSAAHVAPDPDDVREAPSGSDALGTPDDDGEDEGDWYEDEGVTADDLRDELGRRELSKSGNKAELIERLREHDEANAD